MWSGCSQVHAAASVSFLGVFLAHEETGTSPPVADSIRTARSIPGLMMPLTNLETVACSTPISCAKRFWVTPKRAKYSFNLSIAGKYASGIFLSSMFIPVAYLKYFGRSVTSRNGLERN